MKTRLTDRFHIYLVLAALIFVTQSCGSDSQKSRDPDKIPSSPIALTDRELLLRDHVIASEQQIPDGECLAHWEAWQRQYGASTPHQSYNHNSDWPLAAKLYDDAFKEPKSIALGQTFQSEGRFTQSLDLADARINSVKNSRDQHIISALDEILAKTDQKTLTLVHLGLAHSLDYYFHGRNYSKILYAQYPVRFKTMRGSSGFNRLKKILWGEKTQIVDSISYVFPAVFIGKSLLEHEAEAKIEAEANKIHTDDFFQNTLPASNVVFLGDTHTINVQDIVTSLPTSNCLQILGFNKVQFVIEGFHMDDHAINIEHMATAFDAKSTYTDSELDSIKEQYPEAYRILVNGQAQIYPNLVEMLVKLGQYEEAQVPVQYQGFETDYHFTFYGEDGTLVNRSRRNSISSLSEGRYAFTNLNASRLDSVH